VGGGSPGALITTNFGAMKKGYVTLTPVEDDDDEDLDDAPVKEYSADILLDSEYQTAPGKS